MFYHSSTKLQYPHHRPVNAQKLLRRQNMTLAWSILGHVYLDLYSLHVVREWTETRKRCFAASSSNLPRRIIKANPVYRHRYVAPLSSYREPYRNWDPTSMLNTTEAVRRGQSVWHGVELYNVPRSTLSDKVLGKVPLEARSGPPTYLTTEEFYSYLLQVAKIGYAHSRKQVIALLQQVVDSKGIATVVSSGWWDRYVKRHPQLSLRVVVPLSMARAMASDSEVIDRYFNMLEDCLRSNGILNTQACIFNCDETGVPLKVGNIFLAFFC